jgi:hypothetical protein
MSGMKRLFADDCEVKAEILTAIKKVKVNKEPISKHLGTNHKIIPGPDILYCEPYLICQPCCMEVYDDTYITVDDIPF